VSPPVVASVSTPTLGALIGGETRGPGIRALERYLPEIADVIQEVCFAQHNRQGPADRKTGLRPAPTIEPGAAEALLCAGALASSVGGAWELRVRTLLPALFVGGLSAPLVDALEAIADALPTLLPSIQARSVTTLVPIRPRSRGERRSLRTFAGVSLRPPLAFNPDTPRRLSTPTDAFELHPDVALYGTTLSPSFGVGEKDVRDVIYQVAMMRVTFRRVARAVKSGSSAMPTSPEAFAAIVTKSQEESTPEQRVEDAKSLRGAYAGNSPCICGSGKRYKNCCDA
jgi:hypothetical protein